MPALQRKLNRIQGSLTPGIFGCETNRYDQYAGLARVAAGELERGTGDPAYVDADRWQDSHGDRYFSIQFDFIRHVLVIEECNGGREVVDLEPKDTADFYREVMGALEKLNLPVTIYARPNEVPDPIPFAEDRTHKSYDPDAVSRFWRALFQVDRVFSLFRAGFAGKASPSRFPACTLESGPAPSPGLPGELTSAILATGLYPRLLRRPAILPRRFLP